MFVNPTPYIVRIKKIERTLKERSRAGEIAWNQLFAQATHQNIGNPAKIRVVNFLIARYTNALHASRLNKPFLALQFFNEAVIFSDAVKSDSEKKLISVFALPVKAYLHYKHFRYDAALKSLHETLKTDADLEEQGYTFLHYHRIQQLHNIARIYVKSNDAMNWIENYRQILFYLMTGEPPVLFSQPNAVDRLYASPELRSDLIQQVIIEAQASCDFLGMQAHPLKDRANAEIFPAPEDFVCVSNDDVVIKKWLVIKKAFTKNDVAVIESSLHFLEHESNRFDALKRSLVSMLRGMVSAVMSKEDATAFIDALNNYDRDTLSAARLIPIIV